PGSKAPSDTLASKSMMPLPLRNKSTSDVLRGSPTWPVLRQGSHGRKGATHMHSGLGSVASLVTNRMIFLLQILQRPYPPLPGGTRVMSAGGDQGKEAAHVRCTSCAPKARTINGGRFHPESCRLVR